MAETRKLKINAPLRGHKAGVTIRIRTDKKGIPQERYWRDRLKDAKTDNCVEILPKQKPSAAKTVKAETKKKGE
jgi:hypothetical protein